MNRNYLIKNLSFLVILIVLASCANGKKSNDHQKAEFEHTNLLINETSPYLLQHAHNPVNWYPWGDEAFQKAKDENKLVIISIGYSSCHWCHVMEHESFEDSAVAALMNENYVCIKVDREERPDVDQIYMDAVQMMTGSGGWPLNCITLPDARPVYGGTYYAKNNWVKLLNDISATYKNDPNRFIKYAENLTEGIQSSELVKDPKEISKIQPSQLEEVITIWEKSFDYDDGGPNRRPKFPMPNNFEFLMAYADLTKDDKLMNYVDLTLHKMAFGGIYDQIGGGFARYSTDEYWKVPHFEKMLYDNGQLVSLYSQAYQRTKSPVYKQVVYQTIEWLEREMMTEDGAFLSALDADSEGEEGKFYVWSKEELEAVLTKEEFKLAKNFYHVNQENLWEDNYILARNIKDTAYASKHDMTAADLDLKIKTINAKLLKERAKRIRPGIDDKVITSWNALMLRGLVEAGMAFNEPKFHALALKNANWLVENQLKKDHSLFHTYKNKVSKIDGFLDDYAFTITAFIKLYEATFDESWLTKAEGMANYIVKNFKDEKSQMFYFTSAESKALIARKMEVNDNVIPASNSETGKALHTLGSLLDNNEFKAIALQMMSNVVDDLKSYPSGYSNWALLHLQMSFPYYEIAITGTDWKEKVQELNNTYVPNKIIMGGEKGNIPLLEGKFIGTTTIFVCVDKSCQMPVEKVSDALGQLGK